MLKTYTFRKVYTIEAGKWADAAYLLGGSAKIGRCDQYGYCKLTIITEHPIKEVKDLMLTL